MTDYNSMEQAAIDLMQAYNLLNDKYLVQFHALLCKDGKYRVDYKLTSYKSEEQKMFITMFNKFNNIHNFKKYLYQNIKDAEKCF